jgi:hypothetical protein
VARHTGHFDIEHHRMKLAGPNTGQSFLRICGSYRTKAGALQAARCDFYQGWVIINYANGEFRSSGHHVPA